MQADSMFPVMGSTAHVTVVGGAVDLAESARERLEDLEARWSRFIPSSEISRLNHAEGRPCLVSEETRLLVRRALDAFTVTAGRFDPTLLGAVLRAGYVESVDGSMALVELVARDRSAFSAILADKSPNVKVFEKGKHKKDDIEKEFHKYKKDFDLDDLVVNVP